MYAYYVITIELYGNFYSYVMRISNHENLWRILTEGIVGNIDTLTIMPTKKEALDTVAVWNERWKELHRLMHNPPINPHVVWG